MNLFQNILNLFDDSKIDLTIKYVNANPLKLEFDQSDKIEIIKKNIEDIIKKPLNTETFVYNGC